MKSSHFIDPTQKNEIPFTTNDESFLEHPEITDAKLTGLSWQEDKIYFLFETDTSKKSKKYCIAAEKIIALKISNLSNTNISMSLFISKKFANREMEIEILNSTKSAYNFNANGLQDEEDAFFFGNEPSCGCHISLICKSLRIYEITLNIKSI